MKIRSRFVRSMRIQGPWAQGLHDWAQKRNKTCLLVHPGHQGWRRRAIGTGQRGQPQTWPADLGVGGSDLPDLSL